MSTMISFLSFLTLFATGGYQVSVDKQLEAVQEQIVAIREKIHQNPELGNREFETAKLVAAHLRALGMEVTQAVAHTGVVGVLRGGLPGPVVAVRADMDALPVTEDTDLPFKSTVRTTYLDKEIGVSHACGHDIHTAVQLGVASVLAGMRDQLPGTVKFIFQPAEEGPPPGEEGGADLMVRQGVMDNPRPEAVFGLHAMAGMEVGKLGYTIGPAFAAVDHFIIKLHGKQAHGANPDASVDPVVLSAQVVMALQTIRSRNLPAREPSVVTVGVIKGGERYNIIPETVHMEGTVRTYDAAVRDTIERRMHEILDGLAKAAGATFELEYNRGTPATINNPALSNLMLPSLRKVVGAENVLELEPTMGGEDFAYLAQVVPGFYFRLGQVKPGTQSGGHHTPTFRADNSAVPVGIRVMSNVILDYLSSGGINAVGQ